MMLVLCFTSTALAKNYYIPHGKYIMHSATSTVGSSVSHSHTAKSVGYSTKQYTRLTVCADTPSQPESDATFSWWGDDYQYPTYEQGATTNPCPDTSDTVNVWARFEYHTFVTYNANGGTVNGSSTYTQEDYQPRIGRNYVSTSFYVPTPTRSGYTFLYWKSNNSSETGTYVYGGDTISPHLTRTTTLTAQWESNYTPPDPTYYLYYDANGGSRGNVPSSQQMYYANNAWITSYEPTRSGYVFKIFMQKMVGYLGVLVAKNTVFS